MLLFSENYGVILHSVNCERTIRPVYLSSFITFLLYFPYAKGECALKEGTRISEAYGGKKQIRERHRHRYEFNNDYRETLEKAGLVLGGTSPDNRIVETVEVENHPFFVGVQFHPEFTSTPETPNPLFCAFVGAAKTKAGE